MMVRFLCALICLAGLVGCAGQNTRDAALQVLLNEPAPQTASGQFPRFVPLLAAGQGPALDVSIPSADVRGGFLREQRRGNIETWLGNDGASLTFDRGVLHGTRGFGAGLLASDVSASASAILQGRTGQVRRIHTFLNGNDEAVSRAYVCEIANNGRETITLDIGPVSTRRMTEVCGNLDQRFTNTYWVDTSRGRILQSQQWSGELYGMLVIRTVFNF